MLSFCISGVSSNSGKTILTTALLYHFKKSVRPFKIGPDFIDPQFHKVVCGTDSVNLDSFIMNNDQVKWIYNHYSDKKVSILEGVMGFYDGDNKGCSANTVSKLLNIPTILILDGGGSYITVSAVLKGLLTYKSNTIKAIVLNNISSKMHYELIKKQIESDHKNIIVLGWIKKHLESLSDTHLGLDLKDLNKIKKISQDVLDNIDIKRLKEFAKVKKVKNTIYPFIKYNKIDKTLAIVNDKNFSFLYYDNLKFLQDIFKKVVIIDATKDEIISKNIDFVYICGGYVESDEAYSQIRNSKKFRKSLIKHSKTKPIYGECAGLLYLGNRVDDKKMSGILDIDFRLTKKFKRLGYYYDELGTKGHCFHYTEPVDIKNGYNILSKVKNGTGIEGSWKKDKVLGSYLHLMFRNNLNNYFY